MGLFWQDDEEEFLLLYLGGGSVHTISQQQVLIFLESISQTPIAHMFDMIAGDSAGSGAAVALNCPIRKGSKKPRYSAEQYYQKLKSIIEDTFQPYRENYYQKMVTLEVTMKIYQSAIDTLQNWSDEKDRQISDSRLGRFFARSSNEIGVPEDSKDRDEDDARANHAQEDAAPPLTKRFNLVSGIMNRTLLPPLRAMMARTEKKIPEFFFSAEHINTAFDEALRFRDGSPVMLEDTITGVHSEAFNIDKRVAESHTHIKPIKGWNGFTSHTNLPLSEIPKRSMPAQTVFRPYYSEHSKCHYDDIARHNTMAAPMNAIRRKFTKAQERGELKIDIKRFGISIGCGFKPPNIDPEKMGSLLILGRLDSSEGAPLLSIPQLFNTSKAIRDLEEELGQENAIFVDKVIDNTLTLQPYRYREQLSRFGKEFGKEAPPASLSEQNKHLDDYSLIDARPEKIEQLEAFGWAMVWENLDSLVNVAKKGLNRAYKKGMITDKQFRDRLQKINDVFPPDKIGTPAQKTKSLSEYMGFGGHLSRFSTLFTAKPKEAVKEPSREAIRMTEPPVSAPETKGKPCADCPAPPPSPLQPE